VQEQYVHYQGRHQSSGFGESPTSVLHWALPTGRSWQSIASGYVALISILAWPLGVAAIVLGVGSLRRASREGSHGRGRAIFAIVTGTFTTLLLLAVLASVWSG
jgi:Na+/H+-dicarboxylate symporter